MRISDWSSDVCSSDLVWGAAGGLGSMAIQLIAISGANAIGVISDPSKRDFVMSLGAKGVVNRNDFDCWGQLPPVLDAEKYGAYMKKCRAHERCVGKEWVSTFGTGGAAVN